MQLTVKLEGKFKATLDKLIAFNLTVHERVKEIVEKLDLRVARIVRHTKSETYIKNKTATKRNFEQMIKFIFSRNVQRFVEKLNPILEMTNKIEEILDDKVDLVTEIKSNIKQEEGESLTVIETRPINPPKEPRITYNIDKQPFKILDYHAPMITKDTKVI